jgi:hypothetical protein
MRRLLAAPFLALLLGCPGTADNHFTGGASTTATGGHGGGTDCGSCLGNAFTPCDGAPVVCPSACMPGKGCVTCVAGSTSCVGNEVHKCTDDGSDIGPVVETCAVDQNQLCNEGKCGAACDIAADQPSNVGCEFWAVDLDQQDGGGNDPASAPWGVVLSNAGLAPANVTIEINEADYAQPLKTKILTQLTVPAGNLTPVVLPTRELDCGVKPNDYASPGTCVSSRAYRISSSSPIIAYQFNTFANSYSNDASLLLPTSALGRSYRIIGWGAGHPVPINFPGIGLMIDRSYVTIVGTQPGTQVRVKPSWRIKGNPPIAATPKDGDIQITIGPYDVVNLETDDGTFQDDPKTMADLSGTVVQASAPVAVFSGVESTGAPGGVVDIPLPGNGGDSCCLDHLEEQVMPMESVGTHYVVTRSPVRSTGGYKEPDVLRFVGVAETAQVTTSLPPPFASFTIQPGEVKTTWTQDDVVVTSDKPVMIGQILVSQGYVDGASLGDPALTIMPPVEQYQSEYIILTPGSWSQSWIVIAAETGSNPTLDGGDTNACINQFVGTVEGKNYESRRCQVSAGVHKLKGDKPFGIIAYGYGSAGSYALVGGAAVKHVYDPPPVF